jgi:hypothetical protein
MGQHYALVRIALSWHAKVVLAFGRLEVFDGVAQRRTRHDRRVLIKKTTKLISIDPLASFTQRPAHGFMDQVMAIG